MGMVYSVMVPLCVSRSKRWKSRSTHDTPALSAARCVPTFHSAWVDADWEYCVSRTP
jgi:hypothetical protein